MQNGIFNNQAMGPVNPNVGQLIAPDAGQMPQGAPQGAPQDLLSLLKALPLVTPQGAPQGAPQTAPSPGFYLGPDKWGTQQPATQPTAKPTTPNPDWDPDNDEYFKTLKSNLDKARADLAGKMQDYSQIQQKPMVSGISRFGTKDLITGLLPLAISALFGGKKGQEFAGGFLPGYLQGKDQQAALLNANNQMAFQNQARQKQTEVESAQQQAQFAAQDLTNYINQQRFGSNMGYKYDALERGKKGELLIKTNADLLKATDPYVKAAIASQLLDMARSDPYVANAALGPETLARIQKVRDDADAGINNDPHAQKLAAQAEGQRIANQIHQDQANVLGATFDARVADIKLKNTKDQATIDSLYNRAKAALTQANARQIEATARAFMDKAHGELYRKQASVEDQKVANATASALRGIEELQLHGKELDLKQKKQFMDSVNGNLKTVDTQINDYDRTIASLRKTWAAMPIPNDPTNTNDPATKQWLDYQDSIKYYQGLRDSLNNDRGGMNNELRGLTNMYGLTKPEPQTNADRVRQIVSGGVPKGAPPATTTQQLTQLFGYAPKVTVSKEKAEKLIKDYYANVNAARMINKDPSRFIHTLEKKLAGG